MTVGVDVSVILPTFNRPQYLAACLDALRAQDHQSFEVIVIDDGSAQPASSIVERDAGQMRITCLRQENAGPAAARNAGAAAAAGQVLLFTDDDCRPKEDWISRLAEPVLAEPALLTGGQTDNALTSNIYAEASQDLVSFLYDHATRSAQGFDFFTSNNMACSKKKFIALGGFDRSFPLAAGEDRDFGLRWKRAGYPMVFVQDAKVDHYHALTLASFWRQQSNYGRGAQHLRKRFDERLQTPVPFSGLRFYVDMLTYPFARKKPRPFARALLLALSQVAMAAGYLANSMQRSKPPKPLSGGANP